VIPDVPLMIVAAAVFGRSTLNVVLIIGIIYWTSTARLIRAQVKSVRERVYVKRARALGGGHGRLVWKHITPQVAPLLVANTVLTIAIAVFAETYIAFLGLEDPSTISWGKLIQNSLSGGAIFHKAWWAIIPPGLCVTIVILAATMMGQAMEDALNPRLRVGHLSVRRFRLRPDDHDPRPHGAPAAERERGGSRAGRGRGCAREGRGVDGAAPLARRRDGVPGRDERVQPREDRWFADRRADGVARRRVRPGRPEPGRRAARDGRDLGIAGRSLSARVLGGHAPARRDRDGARVQPQGAPRRRADDGARRHGAGPDPRAARPPDGGPRPGHDPRHPRPAGRRPGVPAGGGDVRRQGGGVGADRDALPRSPPSVHADAVPGDARSARRRRGDLDPRSAAAARPRGRRLPVPAPLRLRVRPL